MTVIGQSVVHDAFVSKMPGPLTIHAPKVETKDKREKVRLAALNCLPPGNRSRSVALIWNEPIAGEGQVIADVGETFVHFREVH